MNIPLLTLLEKAADKALSFIPDPTQKAQAQFEILKLKDSAEARELNALSQSDAGQVEINKIEAASDSLFKGGWRPSAGWACVSGLFYQLLFRPVFGWIAENAWQWSEPPSLEMETLITLLFGLLGLGAYRMIEKGKGVA